MQYAVTFLALAFVCVIAAVLAWGVIGGAALLLLYLAVSFALLAAAYAGAGPRLFFKRASGKRSVLGWSLLAPYFLLNDATLGLYRLLSREPPYVQVAPNLSFGRRLTAREAEAGGWEHVLDLAGEFPEARTPAGYRSLPMLDAVAPTEADLQSAIEWIRGAVRSGPVYVHCALGYGRSALVAAAYLISRGIATDAKTALKHLRALRPGVRLQRPQRKVLDRFVKEGG